MTKRTVKLLHVEDSIIIHRLIAGLLAKFEDFAFSITTVENEEAAYRAFQAAPSELVILDYQLTQGDGLSCLRRLRAIDRVVPILAISGTASAAIAAELLEGGADDFIDKNDLNSKILGQSVRTALRRADIWRQRCQDTAAWPETRFKAICRKLAHLLTDEQTANFLHQLVELEEATLALAGKKGLTAEQCTLLCRESLVFPADSPRNLLMQRLVNDTHCRIACRADCS